MLNRQPLSHPIARKFGLLWAFAPFTGRDVEWFSGIAPKYATNADYKGSNRWGKSIRSLATATGATYFPFYPPLATHLTTAWSILVGAQADAITNFSALLTVAANSSWSSPFTRLQLSRHDATTQLRIAYADAGGFQNVQSNTGIFQVGDGLSQYGGTRNGTSFKFYKNGALYSSHSGGSNAISWATTHSINLLNRNYNAAGEGTQGALNYALIFAREITAAEAMFIYRDPSAIFEPYYQSVYPPRGAQKMFHAPIESAVGARIN